MKMLSAPDLARLRKDNGKKPTRTRHLSPPEYVIELLGGPRATGRFVGRCHSSIIKWRKRGVIPPDSQILILTGATKQGWDITASDLILGRDVPVE
jgi:hypothetical protein